MPRNLILHIGTMKTGSTTIQVLLKHNRAALRERGICYPRTDGLDNHRLLAFTFSSGSGIPRGADDPIWGGREPAVAMADACARFVAEMTQLPPEVDRVLLSSEVFSQNVRRAEDISRLRDLLAPFFADITILVYLRRQDGHVASNYSQALRRGLLDRPSLVAWKDKREGFTYDYDRLLTPWAEVFGEAAIKPRIYERDTNKSWDVVADFITATGTGPLPAPPARAEAPRNPSINAAGQRALREIGWILKGDDPSQAFAHTALWRRIAAEMTEALPGRGWHPTQAEARDFVGRFEASNERVRRRWLPERERLFSDDYAHLSERLPKLEPDEDLRAVTTVLIHVLRGTIEREATERKRARRSLAVKRALRMNKNDPKARLELARLTMEAGALDAARQHIEQLLKLAPGNEPALELEREIEARTVAEAADVDPAEVAQVDA